ncbi:serine/threonine protein kinase [Mycobacterium kubicae]|uniref:serine/threonine-protein kinase n=1 Tax=Mycobacterium kubicae TaxID=120959 RepID=UPI001641E0CE|nr:serine/threonine-protein kinase [Mycobacterium kubicae]QNI07621.1 serine/threonine protein kinase [Mycobacterium kubicae]
MDTEYRRPRYRRASGDALLAPSGTLGGRYELREVIGRGGMAEVRDGWDLKLGRPVAIKLLHPIAGGRPDDRLRFEIEARASAALISPHIVVVHDVGEQDGFPFIVMERLPGISLADHIARGPLPPAFVRAVLDDVLAALGTAHEAGVLHRDVKPGNILFTAAGETKLADFGIAKTTGAPHTMTGEVVGTMAYLSPDRLSGKPATPADDLYAVGVVGYEALSGRRPFPQQEFGPLAQAILHGAPPPLHAMRPDTPPPLAAVIHRAMTSDPAQKFTQASEMRAALSDDRPAPVPVRPATRVMELPPPALLTYTPAEAQLEAPHPRRKLWAAAILSTLLLAVTVLLINPPFSGPPPAPVTTTTPSSPPPPPPATTEVSTPDVTTPAGPPAPPPNGHGGKKPKGGKNH